MRAAVYTENFQCAKCGKFAYKNQTWAYWRKRDSKKIYFCSYGCMRAWDREHEKDGGKK